MGLDLGLEQAGLAASLTVELDRWCCDTIRLNRSDVEVLQADVSTLTDEKLRSIRKFDDQVFLMTGGPPCQSFSSGGKRAALNDPRGNLIYEYLRLISQVRPKYFVLENVANLVTAALRHRPIKDRPGQHWSLKTYSGKQPNVNDGALPLEPDEMSGSAIRQVLEDVKQLGYSVNFGVLDAADFGAPQHRLRFVMIGSSGREVPELPRATHGDASHLTPFATVRDAIYDLRYAPGEHSTYTPGMARFFDLVPPGGNWRNLPKELQSEALGGAYASGGGKTGFFRRLSWDEPAPTIIGRANRKASALCHPETTRPLSIKECARLQGFPDDWMFTGAANQKYQQVGNAVPTHLGFAIGNAIQRIDAQNPTGKKLLSDYSSGYSFEFMLENAVARLRASARNKKSKPLELQNSLF